MAIFDALTFNPQGYGGQGGGLLDLLRSIQMQQQYQPGSGFGESAVPPAAQPTQGGPDRYVPVGDYQMPQFGNPIPQPAPQMQQASPDFGNRLSAGLEGFAAGPGLISKLAGLTQGLSTGQSPTNQTAQALIQRGLDPVVAQQVARNPDLMRAVLPSLMGTTGQTDDIKEYQFAKKEEPNLTFQQFMQRKRSVTGEHGLNVLYGTNDKGETIALQPSKAGGLVQAQLPAGVKLSSGVEKIDLGTHWGIMDKKTGNMVGQQPKDIEGKESAEERGKAKGLAQVNLPNVVANAEQTLKIIQDIKNDPYRARGTGFSSILNSVPATGGFDFAQKVEQLKGKAFLEAFQALKGGGAITEIEGKKAENAIARLNVAQSEPSFLQALNDLEEVVTAGIGRAKQRAGAPAPASTPAPPPATGGAVGWQTYFGKK